MGIIYTTLYRAEKVKQMAVFYKSIRGQQKHEMQQKKGPIPGHPDNYQSLLL